MTNPKSEQLSSNLSMVLHPKCLSAKFVHRSHITEYSLNDSANKLAIFFSLVFNSRFHEYAFNNFMFHVLVYWISLTEVLDLVGWQTDVQEALLKHFLTILWEKKRRQEVLKKLFVFTRTIG